MMNASTARSLCYIAVFFLIYAIFAGSIIFFVVKVARFAWGTC